MSGYLAACRAYFADRSSAACLACRGGRAKSCTCIGCVEGFHRPPDPGQKGRATQRVKGRNDNSDLFGRRFSLR